LTEVRAGLATFFAMAYIVSVNASIVASKLSYPESFQVLTSVQILEALVYVKPLQISSPKILIARMKTIQHMRRT
jgi:xanthine/uracil/vitamin C permease (AzgA family)